MKKTTFLLSAMAALLISSCSSSKNSSPAIFLSEEWDIIAVNGNKVDTSKVEQIPYIEFDRTKNQIYGNASCNRFFAELELDSVKSEIRFKNSGATRMMCRYMDTEDAILASLSQISSYKVLRNGDVDMLDSNKNSMLRIRKR